MKKFFFSLLIGNIVFIGIFMYFLEKKYESHYIINETRDQTGYKFINPLLECNVEYEYFNPGEIKPSIEKYIEKELEKDEISSVSYYFRSLKNGEYFGYNLDDTFIPASLLKIPLAMSVLKSTPLDQLQSIGVTLQGLDDSTSKRNYGKNFVQGDGNVFSLHDLLREMLQNSDNNAASLIFSYMGEEKVHEVYRRLGLTDVQLDGDIFAEISVSKYSSFFRVLYNASYLSDDASEYLLNFLARGGFYEGIRYYLPKNIVVANKFGERGFSDSDEKQIHDCGIVYLESPYLVCIMTKGVDFKSQLKIIQDISKMIYDYKSK